jgi:hypothetical protein
MENQVSRLIPLNTSFQVGPIDQLMIRCIDRCYPYVISRNPPPIELAPSLQKRFWDLVERKPNAGPGSMSSHRQPIAHHQSPSGPDLKTEAEQAGLSGSQRAKVPELGHTQTENEEGIRHRLPNRGDPPGPAEVELVKRNTS